MTNNNFENMTLDIQQLENVNGGNQNLIIGIPKPAIEGVGELAGSAELTLANEAKLAQAAKHQADHSHHNEYPSV